MTSTNAFSSGTTQYVVQVEDLTGQVSAETRALAAQLVQFASESLSAWAPGSGTIQVRVIFDPAVTIASGGSVFDSATTQVGTFNGVPVYETVFANELRTGVDLNGAEADVTIRVNPSLNGLYLDPSPSTSYDLPLDRMDFISVVKHELLHALGVVGLRDLATGNLRAAQQFTFDKYVSMIGGQPYVTGPEAQAVYGGPVPLTPGNFYHYGATGANPSTLLGGILNGVFLNTGIAMN
ncbi:MAG: hypothetical protein K0Q43_235 [Ramlibacter sp.]|jgi:hypothetical protein|nr:hypothetical protein [Ramlibacter sp.]